jgi:flagellar biogenesis protein FliO
MGANMTIARVVVGLLVLLSIVIALPGAWLAWDEFHEARAFRRWSTEQGCGIVGSHINWCNPESRAEAAEAAALHAQAARQYSTATLVLLAGLWAAFFAVRWVVRGFRDSRHHRRYPARRRGVIESRSRIFKTPP